VSWIFNEEAPVMLRLHRKARLALLGLTLSLLLRPSGATSESPRAGIEIHAPQHINLVMGKSIVIDTSIAVTRVSVAAPEIVDTVVLSPRQIYVTGKALGTTNLTLWGADDRVFTVFDLEVAADLSRLKATLHEILPEETIRVTATHDAITLSGEISSATRLSQVLAVAEAFAPKKVVNLLQVAGVHQVMLEVRVAEMSRSLVRRLGFNFVPSTTSPNSSGSKTGGNIGLSGLNGLASITGLTDTNTNLPLNFSSAVTALFRFYTGDFSLTGFIDALKENGLVKILAEPTLVALSGQTAHFLAGGEYPIPVPQQLGTVTITYKTFGVGLSFTPTVLGDNKIGLTVTPEVSDLDLSNAVTISGFLVPALTVRRASTVIELADGQSFAIAGLLRDEVRETISKFPLLGDIPILGALFRSSSFRKNETELIIIVTPRLVKPLDPSKQALPTDAYIAPDDFEFYLMGHLEGLGAGIVQPGSLPRGARQPRAGLEGEFGYILP
jgi:pilus assembly protein CpaC